MLYSQELIATAKSILVLGTSPHFLGKINLFKNVGVTTVKGIAKPRSIT